jgi:chemotaxis protein MotB
MKKILIVMAMVGLLVGCVSTKEYKARETDIDSLKQSISSLEAKISALEKENATLKDQLKAVQDEKASIEARLKSAEEDKADLQRENASLKNQLRQAQDERAALEARLRRVEDERAALEARLKSTEGDKVTLQSENTSLKNQLKAAQDERAALEARLKSTEEARANLQQENASLRRQVSELVRQRDTALAEKEREVSGLKSTYDNLMKELNKEIKEGQITITQLKDRLSLSMVEKVLFDSGKADIKKDGQKVLDRVGKILKQVKDKQISIEGHTDNVPIGLKLQSVFPTNWELSTTRATNVARYLQEKAGVDPELLIASGFSEYHPVESNDTEEGRAKNRRIEIVLTPMTLEKKAH